MLIQNQKKSDFFTPESSGTGDSAVFILRIGRFPLFQLPQEQFGRSQIFFSLISTPATDHQIAARAFSAPCHRYDVIQRQFFP